MNSTTDETENVEIVLQRASSLARACGQTAQAILQKFEAEPEITFSVHVTDPEKLDEISTRLETAATEALEQLGDVLDLYRAQAKLRELIGEANAKTINGLLAEREAFLRPAERAVNAFLSPGGGSHLLLRTLSKTTHDATEVAGKLRGIRQRMQTVTNDTMSDALRVSKFSARHRTSLEDRLADLQRRQRDLNEELARENLGRKIKVPDEIVTILRKHKIV